MTKKRQINNHGTGYPAGIKVLISESGNTFCYHMYFCHGASAISERNKRFKSVEDALEEDDIQVGENPEPVTLPAGFVNMGKWKFGQRLLQAFIYRSSFFNKLMVKSDQRSRYYFQSAQTLQYLLRTIIRGFGLMTNKSGFTSSIRHYKSVGEILFKFGFIIFKFLDTYLKFHSLSVGNVHRKFKFIDTVSQVIAIGKNRFRRFSIEKNIKVFERTVGAFAFSGMKRCFAMSHEVPSESVNYESVINSLAKKALKEYGKNSPHI